MSIEHARKLLGNNSKRYTDEELIRIISFYAAIANAIIEESMKKKG